MNGDPIRYRYRWHLADDASKALGALESAFGMWTRRWLTARRRRLRSGGRGLEPTLLAEKQIDEADIRSRGDEIIYHRKDHRKVFHMLQQNLDLIAASR